MNEYTGRHIHTLDDKGRVSVPAQFRRQLPKEGLFIGKGMEGSLILYPPEKWEKVRDGLASLSRNIRRNRDIIREFSQFIRPVSIDGQGRISIPADLIEMSGIDHEVVFLGMLDSIEIWAADRYSDRSGEQVSSLEEAIEDIDIDIY
ncbi:MAG: division/cell wall cluster transcriptional repressor MraZ [Candidatus Fermentibacteraceae bacterium]|nr:division/cell wall cluster transcriptional repressor MraZ [Candidatus Fermentibacteraceae bacterium]MBN2609731.1 division/cell wall cluster transcriptional repressor MraZ [Candidatus Fermentibacteraceae bacterium]